MITVILPGDIVKELGNVMSSFLSSPSETQGMESGDVLVDDIYYLFNSMLEAEGMNEQDLWTVRGVIKDNLLDTLTLICFDKLVDALGEKGVSGVIVDNMEGLYNTNFICRTSHIETLLGGDIAELVMRNYPKYDFLRDVVVNSIIHYDVYNELSNFLERHILQEGNRQKYMFSVLSTIVNLQGYLDFNVRDILNTTIVDNCLVLFLRSSMDDENI